MALGVAVPWDQGVSEYGQESMWRDTATADAERARDLAARLERRAKAEDEVAARDTYLGLLDIAAGEQAYDVPGRSGAMANATPTTLPPSFTKAPPESPGCSAAARMNTSRRVWWLS